MTPESAKLRILHVITGLSTGGAEMMLFKLLSKTHASQSQAVVSMKDEGTIGPRIKGLGVPVYTLDLGGVFPNPFRLFSVRSVVRQFRPHVIQGWMYHGNVMASLASSLSGSRPPVVWDVQQSVRHVSDYGWLTGHVIRLGARISHNPVKIIYVSRTGAMQHEALGYLHEKTMVIPNGIDYETFYPDDAARQQVRAELGLASDNVLIGLVARYHPMKDHAGFLAAAGQLARTHPSVRFMLIGKGVTRGQLAIQQLIREHNLQDRMLLLGERQDTPRLTAALDIGCSASAWGEALSVAIGEAMACAVPCVVTDVGDSAYLVADTGLSVPPSQPEALADALGRLVDAGINGRRQLGLAARRRIETEFSLPSVAHRYADLYRELASQPSRSVAISTQVPGISSGQQAGQNGNRLPSTESSQVEPVRSSSGANLRILHVTTDLETGGAEIMLLKLVSATCNRQSHAVVSLKAGGTIGARLKELGTRVYSLGLRPVFPNPLSVLRMRRILRQFQPDLIQGWMYHGNLMASLAGALAGNHVPVVWNVRQSLEDIRVYKWTTATVIRLGALVSKYPTAVIYNSQSGANHHAALGFLNPKQVVIPNGFDCEIFRPDEYTRNCVRHELGVADDRVLVGLVARYHPIKDHHGFLQAAGLVARSRENVQFLLVGSGVTEGKRELMELIAREGLEGRVFLLGERLDMERVTCALDIACSASWSEGFSNAIGEAMSCGVPCVVTDTGDSALLVGNAGLTVPPRNPEAMAHGICTLIDQGIGYRRLLGSAARERIETEFSLATIARLYEELYLDVVLQPCAA